MCGHLEQRPRVTARAAQCVQAHFFDVGHVFAHHGDPHRLQEHLFGARGGSGARFIFRFRVPIGDAAEWWGVRHAQKDLSLLLAPFWLLVCRTVVLQLELLLGALSCQH